MVAGIKFNGKKFQSREEAERMIDIIWKGNNWPSVIDTGVSLRKST